MDTPQVTPALLDDALAGLETDSSALGLAADGGWWIIGLRRPDRRVFEGVPMSTRRTGSEQLARLRALGHDVRLLATLVDLDLVTDLPAVTADGLAPRTAALAVGLGLLPDPVAAG
jgi:hypothetical protein